MSSTIEEVRNYVGGRWQAPTGDDVAEVWNLASGEIIAKGPRLINTRVVA